MRYYVSCYDLGLFLCLYGVELRNEGFGFVSVGVGACGVKLGFDSLGPVGCGGLCVSGDLMP